MPSKLYLADTCLFFKSLLTEKKKITKDASKHQRHTHVGNKVTKQEMHPDFGEG